MWTANTHTVSYNANKPDGASAEIAGSTAASHHTYDTASVLTANGYTLKGWTFLGWSATQGGGADYTDGQTVSNLTDVKGGSVTLYAVWEANDHTLTLNAMGGSNSGAVGATYDSVLTDIPAVPARHGYNFLGYFDAQTGGEQYFGSDGKAFEGKTLTADADVVLYAQWAPVTYTVELYSEGRYLHTINNVVFGELTLPSAQALALSRENFDFVGWNMYDEQNWAMYNADTLYSVGLTGEQGGVVVLYAAWQEKPVYSLLYDANGGTGAPAMTQAHEQETIVLSDGVPSRRNYSFLGWATSAGAETAQYLAGGQFTMGDAVVTLYAVWKHNPSLSYDANGGTFVGSVESSRPAAGEKVTVTVIVPQLEGHIFEGWSEDPLASTATYRAGEQFIMPDADTVFYAVWKSALYTVVFSAAEGYGAEGLNEKYAFGETVSFTVTGALPKVYINGQLAEAGADGYYSFVVTGDSEVFAADGTKLSLVYSANGGTGAPSDNAVYTDGSSATVSSVQPERAGYTFIGWASDRNAESAEYSDGETVVFAGEDVVLYAVWQANVYKIIYSANSGTGDMNPDEFAYGEERALSENAFEKTGYTFAGWALSEGGDAAYSDGATVSDLCADNGGEITLYAVWEQTVTEITFASAHGEAVNPPFSAVYGRQLPDGLTVPVCSGYSFGGYYTQPDGAGQMIFDSAMNAAVAEWNINVSALTLHPYWIPVRYTIVYVSGQNVFGEQSAVYGTPFALNSAAEMDIAAPAGCRFAGWSAIPSGQIAAYADGQTITDALTQTDGDTVYLYAVFEANEEFAVIYDANGGSNAPVDGSGYFSGDTVKISDTVPQREGYIFAGWSYDPNGDSIDFPFENGQFTVSSAEMPDGGMSLYAVWTAGDTLQSRIDRMEAQAESLSAAVDALESADGDISAELERLSAELQATRAALDALDGTYATDEALSAAAEQLEALLAQAQSDLELQISQIRADLESAVNGLTSSIAQNKSDVEARLAEVEAAYKNADLLINGDIGALKTADGQLAAELAALDGAYKAADEALWAGIRQVQENLDALQQKLEETDSGLETELDSAIADNGRVSLIYTIINIVLGAAVAALAITLVVRAVRAGRSAE